MPISYDYAPSSGTGSTTTVPVTISWDFDATTPMRVYAIKDSDGTVNSSPTWAYDVPGGEIDVTNPWGDGEAITCWVFRDVEPDQEWDAESDSAADVSSLVSQLDSMAQEIQQLHMFVFGDSSPSYDPNVVWSLDGFSIPPKAARADKYVAFDSNGDLSLTDNELLEDLSLITPSDGTFIVGDGSGWGGESGATARASMGVTIGTHVQAWDADLDAIAALAKTDGNVIVGNGSTWVAESGATARASLGLTIGTHVQAWDAQLDDIAALAVTDGNIIVGDGANWVAESGATARASLGLTIGTNVQAWDQALEDISGLAVTDGNVIVGDGANWVAESGATARASLGVAIGSDVQAWDADLDAIAALSSADSNFIVGSATGWTVESGATARTSLGLGSIATQDYDSVNIDGGAIDGTQIGGSTPAAGSFTDVSASDLFKAAVGSAADPSITFGAELTLGIYRAALNTLGISCNSTQAARFTATQALFEGTIETAASGSVGAPVCVLNSNDPDTGDWFPAANTLARSVGGSEIMRWAANTITIPQAASLYFTTGAYITAGDTEAWLYFGAGSADEMVLTGGALYPNATGGLDLGTETYKWGDVYAAAITGTTITANTQFVGPVGSLAFQFGSTNSGIGDLDVNSDVDIVRSSSKIAKFTTYFSPCGDGAYTMGASSDRWAYYGGTEAAPGIPIAGDLNSGFGGDGSDGIFGSCGGSYGFYVTSGQVFQFANGLQSTLSGGDARGTGATDLQVSRTLSEHVASGNYSGIVCGQNNRVTGNRSLILNGAYNYSVGADSVCGGYSSYAHGNHSFVFGNDCGCNSNYSVALGRRAITSTYDGCFVFGDSTNADFTATAANQFLIRASGGVGIGHDSPDTILDINGAFTFRELSSDPSDPDEGAAVIWMSDGTGSGDDGDIMMKITAGATTKTVTLVDFSAA